MQLKHILASGIIRHINFRGEKMQLPLNVLLYKLSVNSNFETQNIDMSKTYDGIKLFDVDYVQEDERDYLYLISESMLKSHESLLIGQQILSPCTFLCVCEMDKKTTLREVNADLPVVLLYAEESFSIIFNKLLNVFHDFEVWDTRFHLALLQQKPLQELLELTSEYLVHPMVVLDRSFSLLGYIKVPGVTDPIMESILDAGFVTQSTMVRLRQDGLISTSEKAENPLINYYCLTTHDCYYSMMYRFQANNHTVGYAIVFKCTVHPKTNYLYMMNTISENLSLYFQQERFKNRTSSEFYESLLAEILENQEADPKQYESRVDYVPGLSMEGRYLLARVEYENQTDLPYSFVCWNLRNVISDLKPFVYQNTLYVLRLIGKDGDYMQFLNAEEEELFRKSFRDVPFQCGISHTFFSLMDLQIAARQCKEAIRLNNLYKEEKKEFCEFKDVYVSYLLKEVKRNLPMKMIESPYYMALKQYDAEHNSNLCEVFMSYLENGRNINQTSTAIYLHRNTVLNKIKKAESVMQEGCNDYQTMIAFVLSYLEDHRKDE